ncbi:MAG: septum formation protein Maf [Alphaproteobacteria bacterium]|nr:MAG: septum formation protein Maf [Alphaproteobacteria bacterium]
MSEAFVLASGSASRLALLRNAGLEPRRLVPRIDEAAIRAALQAEGADAGTIALRLAETKACRISTRAPQALVLGADQILVCDGEIFDKPADMAAARATLRRLRGRSHQLISAAVIAENGGPVWHHLGHARLEMRAFSDRFLDAYLDAAGEVVLQSVGAYQLEARGAQLFSRVSGDYFTILGLPLLETLDYLRVRGILLT